MHLVIIYEDMGNGHRKAADILSKYLASTEINITMITTSELLEEDGNVFTRHWNWLIKHNYIFLADIWLNLFSRIILLPFFYCVYAKKTFKALDKLAPDVVISTGDVNRLIGSYCQKNKIPFFIFITDVAIFIDMLHQHAVHIMYFAETKSIIQHMKPTKYFKVSIDDNTPWYKRVCHAAYLLYRYTLGYKQTPYFMRYHHELPIYNDLKCEVIGPFREQSFYNKINYKEIRINYGIPENGPCIIIANGSLGGNNVKRIIEAISKEAAFKEKLNLIAVCGSDNDLFTQIQNMTCTTANIIPVAQQNSLAELYQIAACSIGRATAGSLMDSIVSNTPLIILKKAPLNDRGTLDIIRKYKIGEIADSIEQISSLLVTILNKQTEYKAALQDLCNIYGNHNSEIIQAKLRKIILEAV